MKDIQPEPDFGAVQWNVTYFFDSKLVCVIISAQPLVYLTSLSLGLSWITNGLLKDFKI